MMLYIGDRADRDNCF